MYSIVSGGGQDHVSLMFTVCKTALMYFEEFHKTWIVFIYSLKWVEKDIPEEWKTCFNLWFNFSSFVHFNSQGSSVVSIMHIIYTYIHQVEMDDGSPMDSSAVAWGRVSHWWLWLRPLYPIYTCLQRKTLIWNCGRYYLAPVKIMKSH